MFNDITFKDGKVWQPRYESLIDYKRVPGLQIEPAFLIHQVGVAVEMTFEIKKGQNVTFAREGQGVACRSLTNPQESRIPGLVETRWEGERRCTLVWDPSDALRQGQKDRSTALRILCQGGRSPANEWEKNAAQVEGGLHVAILNRTVKPGRGPGPSPLILDDLWKILSKLRRVFRRSSKQQIRVLRIQEGRVVYDLFRPSFLAQVPPELEMEPAFRVREGEAVEVDLVLGMAGLQWSSSEGQVRAQPRPPQLQDAKVSPDGKVCRMLWEPGGLLWPPGDRTKGRIVSFDFTAAPSPELERRLSRAFPGENPQRLVAEVPIDPTVIEPPSCTPDGVCIPSGGPRGG